MGIGGSTRRVSRAHCLPIPLVVAVALLACCSGARPADLAADEGSLYFEKNIRPLLAKRCYACHSEREGEREGGLQLDRPEAWARGGDNGPAVVPGDIEASLLVRAVRYSDPDLQMPPSEQLPADAVARLEHWIRIGAPGPRTDAPIDLGDPSDPVAGRTHWAFRPLARHAPPPVQDVEWPRAALDHFVLFRLEQESLQPARRAEARQLVRRVYFQLTGLPPSRQQLESFLRDGRPDAYEQLVERLLSSPQFGERWGRHWLDLARYADSNGLDENFLFREAWRYRNWVIDAVNSDVPYDRFIIEQIAGDQLPFVSVEQRDQQRIAAGFLVVGPKVLLGSDKKKQHMEVADEQIDTIGRAILGQTLGCARCHNHKFDPFPTADYYALAGILSSTQVMEQRHMLNQQRYMERLVGLGVGGQEADDSYEQYWRELPQLKQKIAKAKTVLESLKKGDEGSLTNFKSDPQILAPEASDSSTPLEQRVAAQEARVRELSETVANAPDIPPRAMVPMDLEAPADEHVRLSGQFDQLGQKVPRGFLRVLCDRPSDNIDDDRSGRLELGRWLTDASARSGQLAARVQANRIWHRLIGRGIVSTPDNLGRTGEPPSHPQLLDYLALELIDSDWSVKSLVRQIVLSQTFAMTSTYDSANQERDPDNRLIWRAHRRRLDPELLRDAMLFAADELDLTPMNSSVWYLMDQATAVGANKIRRRTDFPCRSVYLPVIRNDLPELFEVFDFADPHVATGLRPKTTVPTQSLFMLNDEMVMAAAEATAQRIITEIGPSSVDGRIEAMFDLILTTKPTDNEMQSLRTFLTTTEEFLHLEDSREARLRALSIACHAIFASSQFQYLE